MPKIRVMPKPRVMIVEDDMIIAESIKMLLEELGYEVSSMESTGANAVKKACRGGQDVILMDVNLGGGMDGVAAAGKVRACSETPIIFVTGYGDQAQVEHPDKHLYYYLSKPCTPEELQAAIKKALSAKAGAAPAKGKKAPK